jgi:hypothetical protein
MLSGKWTYRSYRNTPELVGGDAQRALGLIFGEGVFTFEPGHGDSFGGEFDMGGGYALTLEGEVLPGDPEGFSIIGSASMQARPRAGATTTTG